MDGVFLDELEERHVVASLFCENFAEIMKRVKIAFLDTLLDVLECVSKVKAVDHAPELKSNKVSFFERVHWFKYFSLMNFFMKLDIQVLLKGL